MFLRRLSAAVVIITCFGWAAMGAAPESQTTATKNGEEKSALAPLAVDFGYSINKPTCNGDNDGSIDITRNTPASGNFKVELAIGLGAYTTYLASTSSIKFSITNLKANTYKVKISDITNPLDFDEKTITIVDFSQLLLTLGQKTNCTCPGTSNGAIKLIASEGDNSSYTYSLLGNTGGSFSNTTGDFINLAADTYSGTVTDGNGCLKSISNIQIVAPLPFAAPGVAVDSIDYPEDKAIITLSGLPLNPNDYAIYLNNSLVSASISGTTAVISNVSADSYTISIKRPGCTSGNWSSSAPIVIKDYEAVNLVWSPNSDPNNIAIKCFGGDTTLNVKVTGGKPWEKVKLILSTDGISSELASNLLFGSSFSIPGLVSGKNYVLFVKTLNDLELKQFPFRISGPTTPFDIISITKTNATCNSSTDGKILVSYTGGTGSIYYSINGGSSFNGLLPANKTITGLAGNASYDVVLRDANGCLSSDTLITITKPNPLSISVLTNLTEQLNCPNSSTASITVRTSGGTSPYLYTLTRNGNAVSPYTNFRGDTVQVFSNLQAGNYIVSVKDGICTDVATDTEIIDPVSMNLHVEFDSILCYNGTTNLIAKATGGTGSVFTYTLKDTRLGTTVDSKTESVSNSGVSFNGIQGSAYRVEAYYGSCNPIAKDTLINNPSLLEVFYQDTVTLNCHGDIANVTIRATGSSPYYISPDGITYSKFSGANSESTILSNLAEGTYQYYIKDRFGCIYNNGAPITIKLVARPSVTVVDGSVIAVPENCIEKNDGKISLQLEGGSGRYIVSINSGVNTFKKTSTTGDILFTGLPSGTYNFTITDSKTCKAVNIPDALLVDQPDTFTIETPVFDALKCFGDVASVKISATGGWGVDKKVSVSSYGYTSPFSRSDTLFTLKAENYTIRAKDGNGCTASTELNIVQPSKLRLKIADHYPAVSCKGSNDAKVSIEGKDGTPGYSYFIVGSGDAAKPLTTNPFTITGDFEATTYRFQLKDANECISNIDSVTITEPDSVDFTMRQNNPLDSVSCYGAKDGRIVISSITGGNTTSFKAYVRPFGGTEYESLMPITELAAGIYAIRVEDNSSNHCTSAVKFDTIYEPSEIVINSASVIDSIMCFGDQNAKIKIDAIGGMPYTLDYSIKGKNSPEQGFPHPSNIFADLGPDQYSVAVGFKNAKGGYCVKDFESLVVVDPKREIVISKIDTTNVSCHNLSNGRVDINAVGGTGTLIYSLVNEPGFTSNGNGVFENLGDLTSSRTYTFRIEDSNSCKKSGSFTISNPSELVVEEIDHHQVICNDEDNGWIKIRATGGVGRYAFKKDAALNDTLRISNGEYSKGANSNYTIKKLAGTTNYQPVVIDKNGCADTIKAPITIVNPQPLVIKEVIVKNKRCFDSQDDSTIIKIDPINCGTRGTYTYTINNWARTVSTKELQGIFVNARDTLIFPEVRDTMDCEVKADTVTLKWPSPFNVTLTKLPITCWDNQHGSLVYQMSGGKLPYKMAINDVSFTSPIRIDKNNKTQGNVLVDTIKGNFDNSRFYASFYDPKENYDIYIKDSSNCIALNSLKNSESNPYLFNSYYWDPIDTFKVIDITTNPPSSCAHNDATLYIRTNNEGLVGTYNHYWAEYANEATGKYETCDSGGKSILRVPANTIVSWHVENAAFCNAFVSEDVDSTKKQLIFVPDSAAHIVSSYNIYDNEMPECLDTRDGVVRMDIKGFSKAGLWISIWEADSTYHHLLDTVANYRIGSDESDKGYFKQGFNPLTGDSIPSDSLYLIVNDSIKYPFAAGFYSVEIKDLKSLCVDTLYVEVLPKDTICPNIYPMVFTPNGDDPNGNDIWTLNQRKLASPYLKIISGNGELIYEYPPKDPKDNFYVYKYAREGVKWDGLDFKGRPVPAGTYMYYFDENIKDGKPGIWNTVTILRGRN